MLLETGNVCAQLLSITCYFDIWVSLASYSHIGFNDNLLNSIPQFTILQFSGYNKKIILYIFFLCQTYIDFEISEGEFERTRALYERLLNRTKHLKVWISYAKFEASAMEDSEDDIEQKKKCIQRARGKEIWWEPIYCFDSFQNRNYFFIFIFVIILIVEFC